MDENRANSKISALSLVFMMVVFCNVVMVNARIITVGGKQHWRYAFNYTDWALKAAPFHVGDILVFNYARPNATVMHNVYRMHDQRKYEACDFRRGKLLADVNAGVGWGFPFLLTERKPYYFGCQIGVHCKVGLMKFSVKPC
eukprot:Gb_32784 [translate_table: standard]